MYIYLHKCEHSLTYVTYWYLFENKKFILTQIFTNSLETALFRFYKIFNSWNETTSTICIGIYGRYREDWWITRILQSCKSRVYLRMISNHYLPKLFFLFKIWNRVNATCELCTNMNALSCTWKLSAPWAIYSISIGKVKRISSQSCSYRTRLDDGRVKVL